MSLYTEFIGQVVRCMPNEEELNLNLVKDLINNPEELREILREDFVQTDFPIFKTVEIGTYRSVEALTADIKSGDNNVSNWAKDVMNQDEFTLASKREEIDLVIRSVDDFFNDDKSHSLKEIFNKAKELGLDLCSAEVAPQLRLAYTNQPKGEYLIVAHEPISVSDGFPYLLNVYRLVDGDRWLSAHGGDLDYRWLPVDRFVFARRK